MINLVFQVKTWKLGEVDSPDLLAKVKFNVLSVNLQKFFP